MDREIAPEVRRRARGGVELEQVVVLNIVKTRACRKAYAAIGFLISSEILRGLDSSFFGIITSRIPLVRTAEILSVFTLGGRVKALSHPAM